MDDKPDLKAVDPPEEVDFDPKTVEALEEAIRGVKNGRIESIVVVGAAPNGRVFASASNPHLHMQAIMAELQIMQHDLVCLAYELREDQ